MESERSMREGKAGIDPDDRVPERGQLTNHIWRWRLRRALRGLRASSVRSGQRRLAFSLVAAPVSSTLFALLCSSLVRLSQGKTMKVRQSALSGHHLLRLK